jgi:hypothetical protein
MEHEKHEEYKWIPIEGIPKKNRMNNIKTILAKKRADHRNAILKDWALRLEKYIEPKVPEDYVSPFELNKCIYCLSNKIGPTGDEFRPSTQRGRQNKINCVPCCGRCNSSKQDKCGNILIKWLNNKQELPNEQKEKIIKWYQQNEKYMLIPLDTMDHKYQKTYAKNLEELDENLNKFYSMFA